jgi:hypothetical protein
MGHWTVTESEVKSDLCDAKSNGYAESGDESHPFRQSLPAALHGAALSADAAPAPNDMTRCGFHSAAVCALPARATFTSAVHMTNDGPKRPLQVAAPPQRF